LALDVCLLFFPVDISSPAVWKLPAFYHNAFIALFVAFVVHGLLLAVTNKDKLYINLLNKPNIMTHG